MDAAYRCFCEFLDGEGLAYQAENEEGDRRIYLGFSSNELPLHAVFVFETKAQRIYVGSLLPVTAKEETLDELIMAVLRVNQVVAVGAFCVNPESGACTFESNETLVGVDGFSTDYAARVIASTFTVLKQFGGQLAAVADGTLAADEIETGASEEEDA